MLAAPVLANESARLDSLRRMLANCAPDGAAFDRITRAARYMFGAPVALISLVERDRQWFKSCIGLTVHETPREVSFCAHAILQDEPLIVEDTLTDPRFADNPLVTRDPKIRFYAGRPLRNSEDFAVGALCIIDRKPRTLSMQERQLLDDLGHWAETLFAASQLSQSHRTLAAALEEAQRERMVDPALHIWSQSAIVDILEREARRAVRQRHPLSVLLMEVNQTDSIDERGGQAAGESRLEDVAHAMRVALRPYDAIGRYGSGEFLVVLPDSDRSAAAAVTQRLRERIERSAFAAGHDHASCTVRTGAAWLAPHADACSAETLVACADHALEHARETGGSLVEADAGAGQRYFLPSWPVSSAASGDDELPGSTHIAAKLHRMRASAADD